LEAARQDLETKGAEVLAVECDVSDRLQVDRMIERAIARFGRIDILVNNAGAIQVGPVESMTLEDFEHAMQVMFWGTVYPTLALLPQFCARRQGRIVNITSIGGKVAVPHLLPYTCAKFAAVGFSEGLRAELSDKGVRVVTVAPGLMRTGSFLNASFKGDSESESAWFGLSSSLPGITMSGDRAARQIVKATIRGDAEKILTTTAGLLARFHGLFPGVTADILGLVDRLVLPDGGGAGEKRGRQTKALQSPLMTAATLLGRVAARRFLQV
jgi:NAD(P)-dependent dehydrogenase (short-subunit alcohol dehydrogenase family)